MKNNALAEEIIKILCNNIDNFIVEKVNNDYNYDLLKLGLDSLAFIRIILGIEEKFKITISNDYLIIDKMNTINKICKVVNQLIKK